MSKPTRFAERHAELDPGRTERNAGKRPSLSKDVPFVPVVPVEKVSSYPVNFYRASVVLPKDNPLFRYATIRAGEVKELSLFVDSVLDGPAYVRVIDVATGDTMLDKDKVLLERRLMSAEWVVLPPFDVVQGQRFDLVIVNEPYSGEKAKNDEQKEVTGSANLMVSSIWIAFMYFAKGGNRGAGQELVGLPARGLAERR